MGIFAVEFDEKRAMPPIYLCWDADGGNETTAADISAWSAGCAAERAAELHHRNAGYAETQRIAVRPKDGGEVVIYAVTAERITTFSAVRETSRE